VTVLQKELLNSVRATGEATMQSFVGDWRVIVQQRSADWQQRVVLTGTATGTQILAGNVGLQLDIRGDGTTPWQLGIEHNSGSGWAPNVLLPNAVVVSGSSITQVIQSEDRPGAPDEDFNDLVVRVEKLGMADQPTPPFSVWPATMQMMPGGIFEASLGRYFMAVTVRNIWTRPWPALAAVGLTARCRSWLQAGGVIVDDAWTVSDQATVGQQVSAGRVFVGPLAPWDTRVIYFKVDVSNAQVRKHQVEIEVLEPAAEDLDHLNRKARAPISVSRTTFDNTNQTFTGACDRGTMTVAVKELAVDVHTFKRAVGRAIDLFASSGGGGSGGGGGGGSSGGCSPQDIERLRQRLRAFLVGKDDDICGIFRDLERCCCGCGAGGGDGGDWGGQGAGDLAFFSFPTLVDYRINYNPAFAGQYGPIPYDDPWWKIILAIIAILLTIAAIVSAAADLANKSQDSLIGTVERAVLDVIHDEADVPPNITSATAGNVDAAIVRLNGSRGLTTALFSYKDAASDEENTTPIVSLGGTIDTTGATLKNTDIDAIIQNLADNPGDPAAQAAVQMFKSGARSGVTLALLHALEPVQPRAEDDGSTSFMVNQITFVQDPAAPTKISRGGDSGSLWLQRNAPFSIVALNWGGSQDDTTAIGTRIEDVMTTMNIKFG
jgi:hypothetical protein